MSDDALYADLRRADCGEIPSPFGELSFAIQRGPVSQQAPQAKRLAFAAEVREALAKYEFFLTGDIQLEAEWLVHERIRYESDEAADVDNIVKPLLDALAGPDGLIVDDCQVQSVASTWIDWVNDQQELRVRIKHGEDFLPRRSLAFVEVSPHLFLPVNMALSHEARAIIADCFHQQVELRKRLSTLGADWHSARLVMPVQRVFHRSRITRGFRLLTLEEYRAGSL